MTHGRQPLRYEFQCFPRISWKWRSREHRSPAPVPVVTPSRGSSLPPITKPYLERREDSGDRDRHRLLSGSGERGDPRRAQAHERARRFGHRQAAPMATAKPSLVRRWRAGHARQNVYRDQLVVCLQQLVHPGHAASSDRSSVEDPSHRAPAVHNLMRGALIPVMQEWKKAGKIRYVA